MVSKREWLRLNLWLICTLSANAFAGDSGRWTFFHPETVTSMSCKVQMVSMQHGPEKAQDMWVADASAERNDESLGSWHAAIAEFPPTDKGMDQANSACMKWLHEAKKRIKAAK